MLGLLIFSVIIGGIVAAATGVGFLFWVVAILLFVCGLPAALIIGLIHGAVEYSQDRADYREEMRELNEQIRMETYLDKLDEMDIIDNQKYYDNQ